MSSNHGDMVIKIEPDALSTICDSTVSITNTSCIEFTHIFIENLKNIKNSKKHKQNREDPATGSVTRNKF